ncbi:hypothetical protein SHIRM173S_01599 [Streptomyces hirsutus]
MGRARHPHTLLARTVFVLGSDGGGGRSRSDEGRRREGEGEQRNA